MNENEQIQLLERQIEVLQKLNQGLKIENSELISYFGKGKEIDFKKLQSKMPRDDSGNVGDRVSQDEELKRGVKQKLSSITKGFRT